MAILNEHRRFKDFCSAQRALAGLHYVQVSGLAQYRILHHLVNETYGVARVPGRPSPWRHRPITLKQWCQVLGRTERATFTALAELRGRGMIESISATEARERGYDTKPHHPQALWYAPLPQNWGRAGRASRASVQGAQL